jgi:tetratricopeptide (TPR) repeat protein
MQPLSRKLLLVLPVSLLFSSLCFAQTGTIEGDVKGEDGKPLAGAVVKIDRTDIKQSFKTKTDKKGHYIYTGLGLPGVFNVTIESNGKDVSSTKDIHPSPSAEINFDLKAEADRAKGVPTATAEAERSMTPAQKAEFEKKKKDAEAALAKNKELNEAFNAGMEAETNKNWDVAIQQFEKAVAGAPSEHVIWSHLADGYNSRADKQTAADLKQADLEKAAADYQKAIELDPMNAAYHNNYALILIKEKKLPEGQAELSKAASMDPTSAGKYYYNLGAVLANIGQNDQAGDAFKKSIAGGYTEAYFQYGLVLVNKVSQTPDGKTVIPDGTIDAFQKYLALAPTGPHAQDAKDILTGLGAPIETSFQKPGQNNKKK